MTTNNGDPAGPEMTVRIAALRDRIRIRPWAAIAGAFALGAYAALEQPRRARGSIGHIAHAGYATVGAIAVGAARAALGRSLVRAARSWLAP